MVIIVYKKQRKNIHVSADIIDAIFHGAPILHLTKAWCQEWHLHQNKKKKLTLTSRCGVAKQVNIYEAQCQNVSKEKNWNKYRFWLMLKE